MSNFFHFYENRNAFDNFHHKAQYIITALIPLLFIVLAISAYIAFPLAVLGIVAIGLMYVVGFSRGIIKAVRKDDSYPPLLISSISGPLYLATLLFTDPSLTGIVGMILVFGIPALLVAPLLIDAMRNKNRYMDDELDNDYIDNTEELQKVS